jgi:hypothetical protein
MKYNFRCVSVHNKVIYVHVHGGGEVALLGNKQRYHLPIYFLSTWKFSSCDSFGLFLSMSSLSLSVGIRGWKEEVVACSMYSSGICRDDRLCPAKLEHISSWRRRSDVCRRTLPCLVGGSFFSVERPTLDGNVCLCYC